MMSDERCMKKINVKVTFFLSLIAVVLLTAGILCGREVWLYEHPEIRITFSCDKRENISLLSFLRYSWQISYRTGICGTL